MPIDEVLRLLTRSKQQGSVEVMGSGLLGRVFVGRGGIDLATTWTDDDLHRHLVNSGIADESSLRRIKSGETTLAAIADNNQAMVDLIREVTVESLFQIGTRGDEFEVNEGSTTPYASPNSFELEKVLEDSRDRKRDWEEVSSIVSDLTGAIGFRRDLGERDEVTVNVDDWKVLCEIGIGASVSEIAEQLGTTEFWAARVAARLIQGDLIELRSAAVSGGTGWHDEISSPTSVEPMAGSAPSLTSEPAPVEHATYEEPASDDRLPQLGAQDGDVLDEQDVFTSAGSELDNGYEGDTISTEDEAAAEYDPNDSWWEEPEADSSHAEDDVRAPEVVAEGLSEIPAVSSDESEVEEDTEAFLEKVFSELESSESDTEEGHGLLRRRRMGSLRDFSSDS